MNFENREIPYRAPSREFERFLQKYRVKTDEQLTGDNPRLVTHVNMCYPYGKFSIPQDALGTLYDLYDSELERGSTLGLAEIPIKHMELPLVIDLDFKWPLSAFDIRDDTKLEDLRKHTFSTIRDILRVFKKVYDRYFYFRDPGDKNHAFWIVTQRNEPYIKEEGGQKYVKDGIHVVNPGIRAFPDIHLMMREQVLRDTDIARVFHDIGLTTPIQDVIDEQVIAKNAWTMYGSRKPDRDAYKVFHILDMDLQTAHEDELGAVSLPRYLSYWRSTTRHAIPIPELMEKQLRTGLQEQSVKEEEVVDLDETADVPTSDAMDSSVDRKESKKEKKDAKKKKNLLRAASVVDATNPEQTKGGNGLNETIESLLELLSKKRGTDRILWLEVGEMLRCLAPEGAEEEFLNLWIAFTQKRRKFTAEDCVEEWKFISPDKGASLATLKFWASKDNPKKYLAFKRNEIREFLMKGLNTTHVDVAQTLYLLYESRFVCSSIKNNKWYEFKNHRWNEIEAGVALRSKISKELAKEYNRFRRFCVQMSEKLTGVHIEEEDMEYEVSPDLPEFEDFTPEEFLSMAEICDKVVVNLKTRGYKDSIMTEAKEFFYVELFEDRLNERHELIAYDNGVVDLEKHSFREGRPDDFITFSTKTKYLPNFKNTKEYGEIMAFLLQIYGSEEMVHYALKERAHTLHGDNPEERIFVWTGVGGNGKSKHRELTYVSLGDYCIKFPVTLFTGRRAASNTPQPEVARAKGARMVYIEEPEMGQRLNMGLMKMMSGGDPIVCRQLYGHTFEYVPQFIITLLCNDLPKVPPHDDGTWRRLTVIEHRARFVDNPTKPNEHKKDSTLSQKIKTWRNVYASLLVSYYWIYKEEGLEPPEEVMKFTEQFRKECDSYDEFVSDVIVEATEDDAYITLTSLYATFKTWVDDNGLKNIKPMSYRDFKQYLQKKIANPKAFQNNRLLGYRERSGGDTTEQTEAILSAAGIM